MVDIPTHELDEFFATYRESYTDLDLDAIVEHYNVPLLSITPDDLFWLTSEEDVRKVMGAYLDTLESGAYHHGVIDDIAYHPLTEQDVVVSSAWTRYADETETEVMERLGTTYFLRDTDEGWKIIALALHDTETMIE